MGKRKPKAICLDLDDTVVNFLGFLSYLYNQENGTALAENDFTTWDFDDIEFKDVRGNVVKGKDIRKFFLDMEEQGLYAAMWEIRESARAIKFARSLGYKIIMLSARNEKFIGQTIINLRMRGIPFDEIIHDKNKVKRINALKRKYKIVLFADDRLDTVEKVSNNCNLDYTLLIDKAHNQCEDLDEDIIRVKDLYEAMRYLK